MMMVAPEVFALGRARAPYRYKAHISVDEGSNLILRVKLADAVQLDSQVLRTLFQGDEAADYAPCGAQKSLAQTPRTHYQ